MLTSNFNNISSFIHMGGYGAYVWPAYLLALVILGGQVIQALRAGKSKRKP